MTGVLAAALCPHPPLLFRGISGRVDVAAGLRGATMAALGRLVALDPDRVVAVGGADHPGPRTPAPFDIGRFGTTNPRPAVGEGMPLSLGVGQALLRDSGWTGEPELLAVGWDAPDEELQDVADELAAAGGRTAVLLLGDGSACRGETAPGFLDERAFGFDDAVAGALAGGDSAALRDLDVALARELMVGGRAVLRLLGRLFPEGPARAALSYREDPFGVSYFVGEWIT